MSELKLLGVAYTQRFGMSELNSADTFSDNLDSVLRHVTSSIRQHIKQHNSVSDQSIDYSYFNRVKNGKAQLSIAKADAICRVIQSVDGFAWVELWMFFVPNFFSEQLRLASSDHQIDSAAGAAFTCELLDAARSMEIITLSDTQVRQITKLADYLLKSRYSRPQIRQR